MSMIGLDNFTSGLPFSDLYTVLSGSSISSSVGNGRNGNNSYRTLIGQTGIQLVLPIQYTSGVLTTGIWLKVSSITTGAEILTFAKNDNSIKFSVKFNTTTGQIICTDGTNTISSGVNLTINTYLAVEMQYTFSSNLLALRVNGVDVGSTTPVSISNISYVYIGTSVISQAGVSSTTMDFSDLYVFDGTGTANTTWGGTPSVFLMNQATIGASDQFVNVGGANKITSISTDDGDTSYISSGNQGDRELFNLSSLPVGVTGVLGIQVVTKARKDAGTTRGIKNTLNINGTNYDSPEYLLSQGYLTYISTWDANPDPASSGNWVVSGVNSAQTGSLVST